MNQEELKQRLIEWMIAGDISAQEQIITNYTEAISYIADFLVRKGVTIREHGEWIHLGGDEWCCPACRNVITTEGSWEKPTQKFCSECGADLRGVKDE